MSRHRVCAFLMALETDEEASQWFYRSQVLAGQYYCGRNHSTFKSDISYQSTYDMTEHHKIYKPRLYRGSRG